MTLEQLLMALKAPQLPELPPPARPLPIPIQAPQGPLSIPTGPPPDVAPAAPLPALDVGLINQLSGTAPMPPPPATKLQRITNMLIGFSEGAAGRGGQFLESLREPQRQFEAATERYQNRRADAIQYAEQRRQRQQEITQRRADEQSEREFKTWMARTGVSDQLALERLQQAHEVEKEARRQRFETERELEREQRRREDDARTIAGRLGTGPGAAPAPIAKEVAEYYSNLRDSLSPAAAKFVNAQAQRARILASRGTGGGGTSRASNAALRAAAEVEGARGERIAFEQNRGRFSKEQQATEERRIQARINRAVGNTKRFPQQLEAGVDLNGWPYVKAWDGKQFVPLPGFGGQQQQGAQPQAAPDPLGVR